MNNALIISYLFLGGMGAGAFFVNAVLCLFALRPYAGALLSKDLKTKGIYERLLGPGFIAALIAQGFGILCLSFDLGRPDRILVFVTNPTFNTVAVGVYALATLLCCSFFLLMVWMRVLRVPVWLVRLITILGLLASVVVMVYTALLLQIFSSVIFWSSYLILVLFVLSSLSMGIALLFVTSCISRSVLVFSSTLKHLLVCGIGLIALETLVLGVFLAFSYLDVRTTSVVGVLLTGFLSQVFWVGLVCCGLVLPMVLDAFSLNRNLNTVKVISAALVLIGGLCLRICIVGAVYYV